MKCINCSKYLSTIDDLNTEIQLLKNALIKEKENRNNFQDIVDDQENEYLEEISNLKSELNNLEKRNNYYQKEIANLNLELKIIPRDIKSNLEVDYRKKLRNFNDSNKSYNLELDKLQKDKVCLKKELDLEIDKYCKLKKEYENFKDDATEQINQLLEFNVKNEESIEIKNKELSQLFKSKQELKNDLNNLQDKILMECNNSDQLKVNIIKLENINNDNLIKINKYQKLNKSKIDQIKKLKSKISNSISFKKNKELIRTKKELKEKKKLIKLMNQINIKNLVGKNLSNHQQLIIDKNDGKDVDSKFSKFNDIVFF